MSIDELDLIPEAEPALGDLEGEGLLPCLPVVSCFVHLSGWL